MPTINKPKSKRNTPRRIFRQKYYQMKEWRDLSLFYRMEHPMCEICGEKPSEHVHHKVSPFNPNFGEVERLALLLNPSNLMALCPECHCAEHHKKRCKKKISK